MLTIRLAQFNDLSAVSRRNFERRAFDYLHKARPSECKLRGTESVAALISKAIDEARDCGLVEENHVLVFIEAVLVFGPRFYARDPGITSVSMEVGNPDVHAPSKAQALARLLSGVIDSGVLSGR